MRASLVICILAMALVATIMALPVAQEEQPEEALRNKERKEKEDNKPFKRAQEETEFKRLVDTEIEALRNKEREETEDNKPFKRAQEETEYKRSTCDGQEVAKCSQNLKIWDLSEDILYAFCDFHKTGSPTTSDVEQVMASITAMIPEIKFAKTTCSDERHHIEITSSQSGCFAHIGRTCGTQQVNLQKDHCTTRGVILHEIYHALGLYHTQQRSDSDSNVQKISANVKDGLGSQFAEKSDMCLECPYQTCSVMHYGAYAFAKTQGVETMKTLDPNKMPTMGLQNGPSAYDICTIKTEYGLFEECTKKDCLFGTDFYGKFKCDCVCPSGLTGDLCEVPVTGSMLMKTLDSDGDTYDWGTLGSQYNNNELLNAIIYGSEVTDRIRYTFTYNKIELDKDCYWDQFNFWPGKSVLDCPETVCGDHSGMTGVTEANFFSGFFHSDDFFTDKGYNIHLELIRA